MFNNSNCGYTVANCGYSLADIAAATGANRSSGNGFGDGDGSWWIILLFLFAFGGWGNGNGWNGNGGGNGSSIREEIAYGFDMNNLESGVRYIQNGLCDGFYAMNTGMLGGFSDVQSTLCQGFSGVNTAITSGTNAIQQSINADTIANMQNTNALTAQLNSMAADSAACCCATQRLIESTSADLGYRLADQSCQTRQTINDTARDIIDNQNDNTRAILDFLTQDKLSTLTAENQSLKFAASQQAQNNYLVSQLREPCPIPAYFVPNPNCCYDYAWTRNTGCSGCYC